MSRVVYFHHKSGGRVNHGFRMTFHGCVTIRDVMILTTVGLGHPHSRRPWLTAHTFELRDPVQNVQVMSHSVQLTIRSILANAELHRKDAVSLLHFSVNRVSLELLLRRYQVQCTRFSERGLRARARYGYGCIVACRVKHGFTPVRATLMNDQRHA